MVVREVKHETSVAGVRG